MESRLVGSIMKGIIIKNNKNKHGTYDGIIETINKNKYYYFNNYKSLNIGSYYIFNIVTSDRDLCDFEAINISIPL